MVETGTNYHTPTIPFKFTPIAKDLRGRVRVYIYIYNCGMIRVPSVNSTV